MLFCDSLFGWGVIVLPRVAFISSLQILDTIFFFIIINSHEIFYKFWKVTQGVKSWKFGFKGCKMDENLENQGYNMDEKITNNLIEEVDQVAQGKHPQHLFSFTNFLSISTNVLVPLTQI